MTKKVKKMETFAGDQVFTGGSTMTNPEDQIPNMGTFQPLPLPSNNYIEQVSLLVHIRNYLINARELDLTKDRIVNAKLNDMLNKIDKKLVEKIIGDDFKGEVEKL